MDVNNTNNFTGYVLAGGKSSRMGADKAFLDIDGETFVERAAKNLAPVCSQVKIVLNPSQTDFIAKLPDGVPHIFDVYENRGAPGAIHAALKDCKTKFAVVLAVDLPNVTTEAMAKLAEIAVASNKFMAIVPRQTDERLQPLCAVYLARFCLPTLENLLDENDSASVNDFLELVYPRTVAQSKLTADASEDLFLNVNRLSDLPV